MSKFKLLLEIILLSNFSFSVNAQIGAFKVSGNSAQIGYQNYRWLGLGFNKTNPSLNQSQWGIEHWDDGLNFWKPFPAPNAANYYLFLSDRGKVGIGIGNTPLWGKSLNWDWHRLQIRGWAKADGWATYSDERLKKNFRSIPNPLQKIMALKAYQFDFDLDKFSSDTIADSTLNSMELSSDDKKKYKQTKYDYEAYGMSNRYGFKAQEIEQVLPDLVHNPLDNKGYKSMEYQGLIPILVLSIQEQQTTIDSLSKQVQTLRQEIVNWKGKSIDTTNQNASRLFQNNPNPFDGLTTISYFIDENASVTNALIEVRDIMGTLKNTLTLVDKSGIGKIEFDGSNLPQGFYIYTLKLNGGVKDSKMFLKE